VIAQGAFVDSDVEIGDRAKLENYASVHRGARVGAEVFLGPGAILTNDRWPRATTSDGQLKTAADWTCEPVRVAQRASVGAGAILLPGAAIGENAMIGAGAVIRGAVPAWAVAVGNPGLVIRIVPEDERSTR
jgi:acetyltransferase-like isoleucine patch superfamily enzyme